MRGLLALFLMLAAAPAQAGEPAADALIPLVGTFCATPADAVAAGKAVIEKLPDDVPGDAIRGAMAALGLSCRYGGFFAHDAGPVSGSDFTAGGYALQVRRLTRPGSPDAFTWMPRAGEPPAAAPAPGRGGV